MFVSEQDDSAYRVRYRSYRLGMLALLTPPLMLYEFAPAVIDGSIETSELAGLIIGILLPLLGAYFLIEFAGLRYRYRLVVVLDDGRIVGLTHGYSGIHDQQLDQIVNQIREYLEHVVPLH